MISSTVRSGDNRQQWDHLRGGRGLRRKRDLSAQRWEAEAGASALHVDTNGHILVSDSEQLCITTRHEPNSGGRGDTDISPSRWA